MVAFFASSRSMVASNCRDLPSSVEEGWREAPGWCWPLEGAGGVLGPWTTVTIAGPRKTIITGLTMAGIYHFQIRAFGKLGGYTDWMDSKTFICA